MPSNDCFVLVCKGMWLHTPDEDLALWCLLWTSWSWTQEALLVPAPGCMDPSRLTLRCRVCSANRVWINESSRLDTQRPFSTRISSPGSRPESRGRAVLGRKKNVDLCVLKLFRVQRWGTFTEGQSVWQHFTDQNPAVPIAIYVPCHSKTYKKVITNVTKCPDNQRQNM